MGEKLNKILSFLKQFIVVILVFISIFYSESQLDNENYMSLIYIFIISVLFSLKGIFERFGEIPVLLIYGLYIVSIYGYTFYQWNISSKKTDKECSITIPRTKNFTKNQYYLYRIIYLTTIILIVVLIQNLLDKGGDLSTWKINPQNFVVILPLLLPLLTEVVNSIVSSASDSNYSINPESLLANFMLGDSKANVLNSRIIMPILFYLLLLVFAFINSYYGESSFPIYILLIFMIGFSFWMRTIFIQDCSLKKDKDISSDKDSDDIDNIICKFEKYGGLQAIIATCFLINMLSYIKNPVYKLFIFIIILLSSGLLTSLFILNIKK